MAKISTRYVGWNWINAEHEEIGKKSIYRNATKGIVWLHSTDWSLQRALKTLLLAGSEDNGTLPTKSRAYLDRIVKILTESRELERWFVSGWTLQEGVQLSETILTDGARSSRQDDTFIYNGGHASVIDLTARVTKVARLPNPSCWGPMGTYPKTRSPN
ncbi:hypothetical protein EAE96_006395 [Botrytis aclada]|nr:hypothetical protein EAE96_006395 [Botrytis aclada]